VKQIEVQDVVNKASYAKETDRSVESMMALDMESQGLINIHSLDSSIQLELKYATTDNFTKVKLYDDLEYAYLHPIAAQKLAKAQQLLKQSNSSLSLLVYDAVRPLSIQKKLFEVVRNTKYSAYVANPSRTGMHNYGMAVDLTICDGAGTPLDMGTPFDFFGKAAGINQEASLVSEGILTSQQVRNRKLLRDVMVKAGFVTIRGEWWHFNASSLVYAKANTKLIE
jgi:D-alanyl-D-alanine dipeptidase